MTLIVTSSNSSLGEGSWIWLIIALLIPLLFALEDLLIAGRMPEGEDMLGLVGLVAFVAALMLLPVTWLFQDFIELELNPGRFEILLLLLALKSLVSTYLYMKLMSSAGVIFGSQVGYFKAFAGIVWSMLLLDEALSLLAWLSFGIILMGLFLVESRHQKPGERVKSGSADPRVPVRTRSSTSLSKSVGTSLSKPLTKPLSTSVTTAAGRSDVHAEGHERQGF